MLWDRTLWNLSFIGHQWPCTFAPAQHFGMGTPNIMMTKVFQSCKWKPCWFLDSVKGSWGTHLGKFSMFWFRNTNSGIPCPSFCKLCYSDWEEASVNYLDYASKANIWDTRPGNEKLLGLFYYFFSIYKSFFQLKEASLKTPNPWC